MRVALMSDIHGNLPALESALAMAVEMGAEHFLFAGDLVGDGPFPAETVERVRAIDAADVIRGNVDRKVSKWTSARRKRLKKKIEGKNADKANRAWTALQLDEEQAKWLAELPTELNLPLGGCEVLVVHGSPLGDTDYIYPSITREALRRKLDPHPGSDPELLVCGHSHIPFTRPVNGTIIVNCGSVGRPADGDSRGAFAMVQLEAGFPPRAEIVRFPYPVDDVIQAMHDRAVPGIDPEEYRRGVKS